jgi:hypothetical protein
MQTFLPYPDFVLSMKVLDWRRLGKQRLEARQLLACLRGETHGWINHPAAKIWRGFEPALSAYMNAAIGEWSNRGFKNTMWMDQQSLSEDIIFPPWLGNEAFHASHRSNLLRKDYAYYSQFGWSEPDDLPYVWPIVERKDDEAA